MKRISLLLAFVMLISVITLTACGGSDKQESDIPEEEPVAEESAEEEPEVEEPETEETTEQPEIDSELVGTWEYKGNSVDETYVFNDDATGHYTITLNGKPSEHDLTFKTEGNKLVITFPAENDGKTDEYSIDGDKLTVKTEYGDEIEYTRKK